MKKLPKLSKLHIVIDSPSNLIYEGDIKALTLYNELGPFDVIQKHTNFISAIKNKIIIYLLDDKIKEIPIEEGIVKINRRGIEIFLGIEPVPEGV